MQIKQVNAFSAGAVGMGVAAAYVNTHTHTHRCRVAIRLAHPLSLVNFICASLKAGYRNLLTLHAKLKGNLLKLIVELHTHIHAYICTSFPSLWSKKFSAKFYIFAVYALQLTEAD